MNSRFKCIDDSPDLCESGNLKNIPNIGPWCDNNYTTTLGFDQFPDFDDQSNHGTADIAERRQINDTSQAFLLCQVLLHFDPGVANIRHVSTGQFGGESNDGVSIAMGTPERLFYRGQGSDSLNEENLHKYRTNTCFRRPLTFTIQKSIHQRSECETVCFQFLRTPETVPV